MRGQYRAPCALEIAAAGGHNMLMVRHPEPARPCARQPPADHPAAHDRGRGDRIGGNHLYQRTGIQSGSLASAAVSCTIHRASGAPLVGGGSTPQPGEISLADLGMLFLDELTEFDRRELEVPREPSEPGRTTSSRAARQAEFPARLQLIAAMGPCSQGYDCDLRANCSCTSEHQRRRRACISAPLLD